MTEPVLSSAHAQRDDGQMGRADHAKRDSVEIGCFCLLHGLAGERVEYRDELHRPGANVNGFSFDRVTACFTELVTAAEDVEAPRIRERHEHVGVQRGERLRVPDLSRRAEEGIVENHTGVTHGVEKFGKLPHVSRLLPAVGQRFSADGPFIVAVRISRKSPHIALDPSDGLEDVFAARPQASCSSPLRTRSVRRPGRLEARRHRMPYVLTCFRRK